MSRERIALDSLASLVIQWQNMFNKVIKEQAGDFWCIGIGT